MSNIPLVVFSDLDGTLLDHESYSWQEAAPALDRLAQLNVPVVLASSKTAAEIAILQADMGLSHWPAIVENGAGVLGDTAVSQYAALRAALGLIPTALRQSFTGFGDMRVQDVVDCTGLSEQDAKRAKQRQFSEPGLWAGSAAEQAAFITALGAHNMTARMGGRFLTLSFGATKADQMAQILTRYAPLQSVALGDAPNDVEMLQAATFGILIHNPHRAPLPPLAGEESGQIIRTIKAGPLGWNTAMMALLDRLDLHPNNRNTMG